MYNVYNGTWWFKCHNCGKYFSVEDITKEKKCSYCGTVRERI